MTILRGPYRFTLTFFVIFGGLFVILFASWTRFRIKGAPLAGWIATYAARIIVRLWGIVIHCEDAVVFSYHKGFIFSNHLSILDILALLYVAPVRFLSTAEVRSWPLIGQIGVAIGTLFVDRTDRASRQQARLQLGAAARYPPIVLFPEGGITINEEPLQPFRTGAFEVAIEHSTPILPCALIYDRMDIVAWRDESSPRSLWRLLSRSGPINAHVVPLKVAHPQFGHDPRQLAVEMHGAIKSVIVHWGREDEVVIDDI